MLTLSVNRHGPACNPLPRRPYLVPNPLHTYEEYLRYYHLDLPGMDDAELARERWQVLHERAFYPTRDLDWHDPDREWLEGRELAVLAEQARRRSAPPSVIRL